MKVPLSWLKDYIDISISPVELAKILTMTGLEVDAIENIKPAFNGVVAVKVLKTDSHPNADKLCLATVSDGTEIYDVVCGAPNCRPGIITALAKIGAVLEDGDKPLKVKKSKIRGVESSGMLCSYQELKLQDDAEGIIEFDENMVLGTDLAELFTDCVFEISLTPNLGHCANIIGIARELHASTQSPFHFPKIEVFEKSQEKIEDFIKVEVTNSARCLRYACRVIKDLKIGPSPQWMQNRLMSAGFRPINNVVDVTNYVLLEMGQPLHAFDYNLIEGNKIIVRGAKENESIITLDEKERILRSDDLLICDTVKPVALAGIMGCLNSEVNENTTTIILESAYFCASTIRKTGKRLGLITEASKRFEKGCDPNIVYLALNRAAMLMQEIADGSVVKGAIDIKERAFEEKKISCRVSRTNKLLGTQLSVSEIESIFRRLKFESNWDNVDTFTVSVPTYRVDISQEVDLIEEVARLYGFENLHRPISPFHNSKLPHSEVFLFEREIRSRMISESLQEFLTCDLIGPSLLEMVSEPVLENDSLIRVLNPNSVEQSCLRTSLLPGLMQVVKSNFDHQNHDIAGFEIGRIHYREAEDKYHEETVLGIVLTGNSQSHNWGAKSAEVDFYDLKGIVENMLSEFGITDCIYTNNHLPCFHTGRQASVCVNDLEIGTIGEIHPSILRKMGTSQKIYFGEFNLQDIHSLCKKNCQMKPIAKYPCSERDWTITMKEEVPFQDISLIVKSIESNLLEECKLLDVYRSSKLGDGLKNITLRFVYRDQNKTISQEIVDWEHARVTDKIRSLMAAQ